MTGADAQFLTDRFPLDEITASLRSFGLSLVADVPGGRDRSPPRRRSPHSVSEPEAVHRTWLDTFDWRLHGANAELQQIDIDGRATLELRSSGGRAVRADGREIADLAWPAIAETLPGGPLQDCVAQLAGIRALQVTARATVRRWTFRAVNGDDKTVARVLVEDEVSPGGDNDGVSVRIYVEPLRGYERPARRIGTVLGSLPGVDAAPTSCYERILTAPTTGVRRPDAWGGGTDLHLTPSLPAASAVRAMLCSFREAVLINRPGVLEDVDTEFLHDLRVAVRRARSILKLTGDVLTETRVRELATELKWLGDVTTPTRDLDVYLAEIPAMTKRLRAAAPTDLDAFGEHLRRRR
nr:CHAD domain-containing protein [Acidimicrobiia bacterium]